MSSYKALQIKLAKKLSGDFLGSFMSAFRWQGMEFENLREYFPGDSVRKIDWKTTAKQHKVFIKNFREERDVNALFIFDISESFSFGSREKTKLDTCKEVFYMLASAASSNGFRIWSQLPDTYYDFSSWNKNIIKTLTYLDDVFPSSEGKYPQRDGMRYKNIKNSLIFIFSDTLEHKNLSLLARYNDVVYINIFDTLETSGSESRFMLPIAGMMSLFWKIKQSQYQQSQQKLLSGFKKILRQKHIRYLALDDQDNLVLSFYKFFAKII